MHRRLFSAIALCAALTLGQSGAAQETGAEQDSLKVYFSSGSARITADQKAVLDQAARLFREATPIVMIVSGVTDTTGSAATNLRLSLLRARAVADGLAARGIPADRLQVLGRGVSELEVETEPGTPEQENRVAEITWR